jgi:ribonuclease HII
MKKQAAPDWKYETSLWNEGRQRVAGVDEVGRGPLAGPVMAAAVVLPRDCRLEGLNDSKKLTERQRERLYEQIIEHADAWSVAQREHTEIDEINILQATLQCMQEAVAALKPDAALIDGNQLPELACPAQALVKGDSRSCSIAAASIVAKVTRDRLMCRYAQDYSVYGWESNKGYASRQHITAIHVHGLSPLHRVTFCQKILASKPTQLEVFGSCEKQS